MNRRTFLKDAIVVIAGVSLPAAAVEWLDPREILAAQSQIRWEFLVDTYKCAGCGFCVKACKAESDIPYEATVTRTWIERYVVTRSGEIMADSPQGGRDGFTSGSIDLPGGTHVPEEEIIRAFFVPKLCNHCENPPCVQVCPVGATYSSPEGVVLVDRQWCIGCGYCIMACPYGSRFFHPVHKSVDKCTLCTHRLARGDSTACVENCPFGARRVGNLRDPDDAVTRTVASERLGVIKDSYGSWPQVYYLGLGREVLR
jgi:tetrathionate reductase subunit B